MAAGATCVRIAEARDKSAASERGTGATFCDRASRKESWADVMSDLSDSTDAPDPQSLDEDSEGNSGHHSGGESAGADDGPQMGRAETPLTLASARTCAAAELRFMVGSLHAFLAECPALRGVQLEERSGATKISAELSDLSLSYPSTKEQWILEPARQALATTVQGSQSVYMLGYCAEAFENFYGEGFRATLGVVPTQDEGTVCWDTFQWGYCSRPASCKCKHPHKQDLMEVSVFLRRPKRR